MITSSSSRNSSKNMPRFDSNDMIHNHNLEEARKKTPERNRNSQTRLMRDRLQNTTNSSKPKPRSTNQTSRSMPTSKSSCVTITAMPKTDHFWNSSCVTITTMPKTDHSRNSSPFSDSKHFICSTCQKCIFNANHDACITKFLKEVNSHAKIFTGHMFSPNKTSDVYEKTSPRSDLRWKPTGRIFKTIGLRWIPTGKLFNSCTSSADSKSTHGSNVDISKIHECKQTLDLSAGTSIYVRKEQSFDLNAGTSYNVKKDNIRVWLLKKLISQKPVLKWIQNWSAV
ncbi:hypothetical protein Tco_1071735 [Tanacetum coccineum]